MTDRLIEEKSQRVLVLIATAFRDKAWKIDEARLERVRENMPSDFRINDKGLVI